MLSLFLEKEHKPLNIGDIIEMIGSGHTFVIYADYGNLYYGMKDTDDNQNYFFDSTAHKFKVIGIDKTVAVLYGKSCSTS